jgi:hypothetical protein
MHRLTWVAVVVCACGNSSGMSDDDGEQPDARAGSGSDTGSGSSGPMTALATCVSETNKDRALNGKAALTESSQLEAYAATGAMVDFSSSPHNHFSMTSGGGIALAENECPVQGNWNISFGDGDVGKTVVACVAAFYAEGPGSDYSTHGHYINMMGDYSTLGCGIYEDTSNGNITIVQDYGM